MAGGQPLSSPPRTTAIGALAYYVSHANPAHYDPSNITFGIMEPLASAPRSKVAKKLAISERALGDLERWRGGLKAAACIAPDVGHAVPNGLQAMPNR